MIKKREFRHSTPERTCTKVYAQYRSYKPYLVRDFQNKCGYCDDFDGWVGGPSTYHIDHFAPKIKFKELVNHYGNLVYACSYCNRYKSDDWPSDDHSVTFINDRGYIDPCEPSYHEHFYRDDHGNIHPNSPLGEYMYKKLQLYLGRHRVIWNLSQLMKLKDRLRYHIKNGNIKNDETLKKVNARYMELSFKFDEYINDYLLGDLSKYER
jgi:hypothetical protein